MLLWGCGAADDPASPLGPPDLRAATAGATVEPLPVASGTAETPQEWSPFWPLPWLFDGRPDRCVPRVNTRCDDRAIVWEDGCGWLGPVVRYCRGSETCVEDEAGARCEDGCVARAAEQCMEGDSLTTYTCDDVGLSSHVGVLEYCPETGPCVEEAGRASCGCDGPTTTACAYEETGTVGYVLVAEYDACGNFVRELAGGSARSYGCRTVDGVPEIYCSSAGDLYCSGNNVADRGACGSSLVEACALPEVCVEDPDIYWASCQCLEPAGVACIDGDVRRIGNCEGVGEVLAACDGAEGACVEASGTAGCGAVVVDRTVYPTVGGTDPADLLIALEATLEPRTEGAMLRLRVGDALGRGSFGYWRCDLRLEGTGAAAPSVWTGTLAQSPTVYRDQIEPVVWSREALAAAACGEQRALYLTCDELGVEAAVYGAQPIVLEKLCP